MGLPGYLQNLTGAILYLTTSLVTRVNNTFVIFYRRVIIWIICLN